MATTLRHTFGNASQADNYMVPINRDAQIIGVLNALLLVVGVPGNSLVIIAVLSSRKLQNASNYFIVNLASADLMTSLIMPMFTAAHWINYYNSSADALCVFVNTVSTTSVGCSFLTLVAIAICRYVLIASPHRYFRLLFEGKKTLVWVATLWLISCSVVILPPFAFDVGKIGFDPVAHTCSPLPDYHSSELYNDLLVYIVYPLPLLIIICCYFGVLIKITLHKRRMNRRKNTSPSSSPRNAVSSTSNTNTEQFENLETESREKSKRLSPMQIAVTRNMFVVFCAFVLCLTPHAVCTIFDGCIIERYTRFIVALNSVVNPIIYGFNHPIFRAVFISLLRCKTVPEPSSLFTSFSRTFYDVRSSS